MSPAAPTPAAATAPPAAVLHWGVKQVGKGNDWVRPAEALLPPGSELIKDSIAAETAFHNCTGGRWGVVLCCAGARGRCGAGCRLLRGAAGGCCGRGWKENAWQTLQL